MAITSTVSRNIRVASYGFSKLAWRTQPMQVWLWRDMVMGNTGLDAPELRDYRLGLRELEDEGDGAFREGHVTEIDFLLGDLDNV